MEQIEISWKRNDIPSKRMYSLQECMLQFVDLYHLHHHTRPARQSPRVHLPECCELYGLSEVFASRGVCSYMAGIVGVWTIVDVDAADLGSDMTGQGMS